MKFLKSSIFTLLMLIGLLMSYMFIKFDSNHILKLSAEAYEKGKYQEAHKTLQKLQKKSGAQAYLYDGYALRALQRPLESTQAFQAALEKSEHPALTQEASFNLLYNLYTEQNFKDFKTLLDQVNPKECYARFFQGVYLYHQKNYSEALLHLNAAKERKSYSSWMKKDWQQGFSTNNEVARMAHCLIEIGELSTAQAMLIEQLQKQDKPNRSAPLTVLALSYLKEAKHTEPDHLEDIFALLKKAHNALSALSKQELINVEKTLHLSAYFKPHWKRFVEKAPDTLFKQFIDLQKDLLVFNSLKTEELNAFQKDYSEISVDTFFTQAQRLHSLLSHQVDQKQMAQVHFKQLLFLIQKGEVQALNAHIDQIQKLFALTEEQKQLLSKTLQTQINDLLSEEKNVIAKVDPYFLFWDAYEREENQRAHFLKSFYPHLQRLWEESPKQALQFSKYLERFAHQHQKSTIQKELLSIMKKSSVSSKSSEAKDALLYFKTVKTR